MFKNLELTCHLTLFHDEFIVTPSGWKPLDAASVCRESTQILQNFETSSRSAQAPLTLKVNPLLISTCSLNTNIRCHIFRPIRCEKHVVWPRGFDSLLCHFALFHSTVYPRWWDAFRDRQTNSLPKIRCSRNDSLDNGTNSCWFPLARKWPTWKWTWIWILYGKIEKKCPRYFRRDSRGNPRDLNMCRTGRSAALSRGRKSMPPRRESMKLVVQQRKFT